MEKKVSIYNELFNATKTFFLINNHHIHYNHQKSCGAYWQYASNIN